MSGKLTAEQVRDAIRKHAHDDSCYIFEVYGEECDAIADELNAMLGGGECEMVTSGTPCDGNADKACTLCGAYNIGEYYDGQGHIAAPKFCPECGRRVKAVKR